MNVPVLSNPFTLSGVGSMVLHVLIAYSAGDALLSYEPPPEKKAVTVKIIKKKKPPLPEKREIKKKPIEQKIEKPVVPQPVKLTQPKVRQELVKVAQVVPPKVFTPPVDIKPVPTLNTPVTQTVMTDAVPVRVNALAKVVPVSQPTVNNSPRKAVVNTRAALNFPENTKKVEIKQFVSTPTVTATKTRMMHASNAPAVVSLQATPQSVSSPMPHTNNSKGKQARVHRNVIQARTHESAPRTVQTITTPNHRGKQARIHRGIAKARVSANPPMSAMRIEPPTRNGSQKAHRRSKNVKVAMGNASFKPIRIGSHVDTAKPNANGIAPKFSHAKLREFDSTKPISPVSDLTANQPGQPKQGSPISSGARVAHLGNAGALVPVEIQMQEEIEEVEEELAVTDPGALRGYQRRMQSIINSLVRKARKSSSLGRSRRIVTVYFRVHRDGSLKDLRIEKAHPREAYNRKALEVIQRASPFPVFPEEIVEAFHEFTLPLNFAGR